MQSLYIDSGISEDISTFYRKRRAERHENLYSITDNRNNVDETLYVPGTITR